MATQTQINAKATDPITAGEADRVREILGFDGTTGTTADTDMLAKLAALSAPQRQRLRAYVDDWDAISQTPVRKEGGASGTYYDTDRHRNQVREFVRVLLAYPGEGDGGGVIGGFGRISVGSGCPEGWWP